MLKRDPTLAFRLLRYLNSPAFGLSVEISSFGHALMMLGYQRLKRWLALLLASSSRNAEPARRLMYAAVRRGLLMEELARGQRRRARCAARCSSAACSRCSTACCSSRSPTCCSSVPVPERVRQALARRERAVAALRWNWRAPSRTSRCWTSARTPSGCCSARATSTARVLAALAAARALD
ncbi:MAG: HDOD domain-containing protein [Comamonadaceae bacterium]|nr:HDOD domain-containing protein [Comamonadaceae bacterium]